MHHIEDYAQSMYYNHCYSHCSVCKHPFVYVGACCDHAQYSGAIYMYNSYLTVIWMHEMHGRMYPNYCQITIMLVVDLCSSLAYFMMTQSLPIAGKLPIKTLVARQLPTNGYGRVTQSLSLARTLSISLFH